MFFLERPEVRAIIAVVIARATLTEIIIVVIT
jgi:hypothetical protein